MADDWEVLGVRRGAPWAVVRARWLALAKELHPDLGGGGDAAARLAEVNAAYQRLRQGAEANGAEANGAEANGAEAAADAAAGPAAWGTPGPTPWTTAPPAASGTTAPGADTTMTDPQRGGTPMAFAVDDFRPVVFEAVLLAAVDVGDVTRADEPFSLDMWVGGGSCHIELFPQAGGSVVSVDCANVDAGEVAEALAGAIAAQGLGVTLG